MYGNYDGDSSGSPYEIKEFYDTKNGFIDLRRRQEVLDFNAELFPAKSRITDDSILTGATIEVLLDFHDGRISNLAPKRYEEKHKEYFYLYNKNETDVDFFPTTFSRNLSKVATSSTGNGKSAGNGSAMRVAPIAFYITRMNQIDKSKINLLNINKSNKISSLITEQARSSCLWSHSNSSAILWTEALSLAIYIALTEPDNPKSKIKREVEKYTGYSLDMDFNELQRKNSFSSLAEKTVPLSIIAYLNSIDFDDALRKALSLGGDTDTIACMACGLAEAEYGIPNYFKHKAQSYLDERILANTERFYKILKLDEFYKAREKSKPNKVKKEKILR